MSIYYKNVLTDHIMLCTKVKETIVQLFSMSGGEHFGKVLTVLETLGKF